MEKKLQPLKNKLLLFFFFVLSVGVFGQTLVNYPLNNNLSPDFGPNASITPANLQYFDPPSTTPITNTQHALGHLDYYNSGDYLQFSFTLPANDNVTLQVNAGTAVLLSSVTGNIQIYAQIGSSPEVLLQQQNLNAASSFFQWVDTSDVSFSLPLVNTQSSAVPVKIRIVGNFTKSGLNIDYFGINNISLVREITSISVRSTKTPQPPVIAHNSGASVTMDTDFGSLLTNEETLDKTYRITNTGSRTLNVSSIYISPNNADFSIFGAIPSTINAGQSSTFIVRFAPTNQGLKTAEVVITGNITPDNPFRFEVKGNGKSCNLEPIPILVQNFETSGSNLNATVIDGTPNITGGNSNSPNPNTIGAALYPSNTNLYASGSNTRSLFVRGTNSADQNGVVGTGEVTLEFGAVDLTGQQEVSVNFEVAAFSTSNVSSSTNNTGSGVNGYDYVLLQIMNPDGSWSDEIRLNGASGSSETDARSYKYGFGGTQIPESNYDGALVTYSNSNSVKYGKFKLNIPVSELTANFKFRIKAITGRSFERNRSWNEWQRNYNRNLWLIDNVHIDAGNAKVKTWTGTGWIGENTNRPTDREKAVFNGTYNFSGAEAADLTVCECEVKSGKNVTIPANRALTVRNKITNLGNGNNFVVQTGGNLIQIEDEAVNTGSITAERTVSDINNISTHMDYLYWSAPVTGQGLKAFSLGTPDNRIFQYNEPNDLFKAVPLATEPNFVPGKGYAFRAESGTGISNPYSKTYKFKGVPNNGLIEREVQRSPNTGVAADVVHGYNLIGNPYPSNMSFEQFYQLNKDVIYNTAWFWTNNFFTPNQQGSGYGQNNYAVWNGTGGVAATTTAPADSNPSNPASNTTTPNGIVTVGQGFIVQVKNLGLGQKVQFRNRNGNTPLRVSTSGTFFSRQNEEKDRFWLKLISADSIVNSQLIGYIDGATHGYEQDYDAELMSMSSDVFYSLLEDRRLQIQGKGAFDPSDKVQLGANIFKNGNYTIAIENPEGIFNAGQKVYLKDNLLNRWVDLKAQAYTFEATKGITEGRFEIVYESPTVLATDAVTKDELMVYRDSGDFVVKAKSKKMTMLEVYDASGRLVYTTKPNDTKVVISGDRLNRGVYILKINQDGVVTAKKILK